MFRRRREQFITTRPTARLARKISFAGLYALALARLLRVS
jgi:hypothetical protein